MNTTTTNKKGKKFNIFKEHIIPRNLFSVLLENELIAPVETGRTKAVEDIVNRAIKTSMNEPVYGVDGIQLIDEIGNRVTRVNQPWVDKLNALKDNGLEHIVYANFQYPLMSPLLLSQSSDVSEPMKYGFIYAPGCRNFVLDIGKCIHLSVDNDKGVMKESKISFPVDEIIVESEDTLYHHKFLSKKNKGKGNEKNDESNVVDENTNEVAKHVAELERVLLVDNYIFKIHITLYSKDVPDDSVDSFGNKRQRKILRPFIDCVIEQYEDIVDYCSTYDISSEHIAILDEYDLVSDVTESGVYVHSLNPNVEAEDFAFEKASLEEEYEVKTKNIISWKVLMETKERLSKEKTKVSTKKTTTTIVKKPVPKVMKKEEIGVESTSISTSVPAPIFDFAESSTGQLMFII